MTNLDPIREAFEEVLCLAERVDGWESFPQDAIDKGYKALAALDSLADSSTDEAVAIPKKLAQFLLGESGIDGKWFDDDTESKYWWREQLHDLIPLPGSDLSSRLSERVLDRVRALPF